MKFGIFDHMDRSHPDLGQQYGDRIELIRAYDAGGFHGYHMAEHHGTPLGLAPSPSVFIAAAAQHSQRLRLGTLVYTLPQYHPLRLAEEICMLDHLTGGRFDFGIGRGHLADRARFLWADARGGGRALRRVSRHRPGGPHLRAPHPPRRPLRLRRRPDGDAPGPAAAPAAVVRRVQTEQHAVGGGERRQHRHEPPARRDARGHRGLPDDSGRPPAGPPRRCP